MSFLNLKRKGKNYVTLNFFERILKKRKNYSKIYKLLNMSDFDVNVRYGQYWKRTIKALNSLPNNDINPIENIGAEFQDFKMKEKESLYLLKTAYIELLSEIIEKSDKERKI